MVYKTLPKSDIFIIPADLIWNQEGGLDIILLVPDNIYSMLDIIKRG